MLTCIVIFSNYCYSEPKISTINRIVLTLLKAVRVSTFWFVGTGSDQRWYYLKSTCMVSVIWRDHRLFSHSSFTSANTNSRLITHIVICEKLPSKIWAFHILYHWTHTFVMSIPLKCILVTLLYNSFRELSFSNYEHSFSTLFDDCQNDSL